MTTSRRNLIVLLLLVIGALVFLERSTVNGRLANTRISRTDQGAYIKYAISQRDSDFSVVGRRNRMPAYPALLALFMDKGETADAFFDKGKQINLWLTLAGLVFIAAVFLRAFPPHQALNLLFLAAFTVFAFKAAYVQAEVLYYVLSFAAFLLCWSFFRQPNLLAALLAGGLFGLVHLTKASILPGLFVFLVFYPLDTVWQLSRGKSRAAVLPLKRLTVTALVALAFLAVIFPYISKSKEIFGHYFYNVNSTFYIWCDSWEDAESRTKAAGDRKGWPDLPADEIPSLKNYLRTHDAGQITGRMFTGISRVFNSMAGAYGYLWFSLAYLAFAGWITWCKRAVIWRLFRVRPLPAVAIFSCLFGYYVLIAWYSQIIEGNRFVLSLFLPFLFSISMFIFTFSRKMQIPWRGGASISAVLAFNTAISVWLLAQIAYICIFRLPTIYGGN